MLSELPCKDGFTVVRTFWGERRRFRLWMLWWTRKTIEFMPLQEETFLILSNRAKNDINHQMSRIHLQMKLMIWNIVCKKILGRAILHRLSSTFGSCYVFTAKASQNWFKIYLPRFFWYVVRIHQAMTSILWRF